MRLMNPDECHPELWKGANRKFKKVPWQKKAREVHDRWGTLGIQSSNTHAAGIRILSSFFIILHQQQQQPSTSSNCQT